jgi:hypothetical protein
MCNDKVDIEKLEFKSFTTGQISVTDFKFEGTKPALDNILRYMLLDGEGGIG